MVFKKHGRKKGPFYTWPTLPGFGRIGPYSTGLRSKALAQSVEQWLRDVAASDPEVVRGILAGRFSLREAYVAHKEGRLAALKAMASDPPLREVVRRFRSTVTDRRVQNGLGLLEQLAPRGARFSYLSDPKRLSDLLHDAVASGLRVNSVHRGLYAAIKAMLVYELGNAEKRRITADVVFRHEDDSRDVTLTAEQARRLLAACDEALRPLVAAAVLTGVDRGPLLRLTPAHVDLAAGTLRVPDTKNRERQRTLELSAAALAVLRLQIAGRSEGERIFSVRGSQVDKSFPRAAAVAGLPGLRFKDLRHVFATTWVQTGGGLKDLGGALGHSKASTSLRYTASQARAARNQMDAVAEKLGMGRAHLRAEKGGGA
jgi:integrase